ncbi:hybrid sensor histidine kinase/response regulator [Maribellus sediminis]|uniref:hybrid sensor histidine kinase/response regulator n=1 Tax=Maribellus sediminis TaxID=2696285 RepID=UPI0014317960|nr:hybrid sensor histidine kinase/response regulator [Maribellus sediminis]
MKKRVILCIDDEEIILQALEEQLKNIFGKEYEIETSDSGDDAIEFFRELTEEGIHVPVVISDYIMPGKKGDEVLKEIHQLSPGSLKILLTGHADFDGISNAINNAQLYRYIAKPWDKDDLVLTVKEAIKSFLQEAKIRKQNKELIKLNASLEEKVKERTKELSVANASKDKFFSIIAHDLRSPFNALFGLTDFLIGSWEEIDEETKLELITDLQNSSKVTFNLLQNLLEWSRSQTGKIIVEAVESDAGQIINENIAVLRKQADHKQITVANNVPDGTLFFGDKNMISTVFRNLISNSVKFTNIGGEIEISVNSQNGYHEFCVSDNGIGMDEDTLNKLFLITEKVKRSGTANEEGTGLGLILCKEFVEKNGGSIRVESSRDVGSKFFFTLPVKA